MKKRILSLLLVIAMLSLVACTAPADISTDTTSSTDEQSTVSSEDSESDPLIDTDDYKGRTFTILQRSEHQYEFTNDENTIDFINEKIAERNNLVQERYGITIKTIERLGDWGQHDAFSQQASNEILGGSTDYDLIAGYAIIMPSLTGNGCLLNWNDCAEYMNLDREWWYQDFIDQMTINDRLYMITGDIALTVWEAMTGMFFNKDLVESVPEVGNLYDVAREGDWTYDYFLQTLKACDPKQSGVAEDQKVYSYLTYCTTQIDLWQDAFDINVTDKDANGKPYFAVGNSTKMVDTVEKIYDLTQQEYVKFVTDTSVAMDGVVKQFGQGKAYFCPLNLSYGTTLAQDQISYGILPMPKYDENQDNYTSTCRDDYSVFGIPLCKDADKAFIATITEALCYYSNKVVVPAYYETILKTRNTYDTDSEDMIDEIRKGLRCNFGYLYSMNLEWAGHQMNVIINAGSKEWVSNWESKVGSFESALDLQLEYYYK